MDEIPNHTKLYRFLNSLKEEVNRQINEMLQNGITRRSSSPWYNTIWIVPKKWKILAEKNDVL